MDRNYRQATRPDFDSIAADMARVLPDEARRIEDEPTQFEDVAIEVELIFTIAACVVIAALFCASLWFWPIATLTVLGYFCAVMLIGSVIRGGGR
jgi:cation transport ATPase